MNQPEQPRVWIERPIRSVEDAEALPVGTVAVIDQHPQVTVPRGEVALKDPDGSWVGTVCYANDDASMVGWVALVPVELEEEPLHVHAARPDCDADRMVRPYTSTGDLER